MAIFMKVKGKVQGDIQGGVTASGHVGEIEIQSCEFNVVSPRDVASGMPSGKRQWRPIQLSKPLDKATPKLVQALVSNEVLTEVTINYWRTGLDGKTTNFVKIVLTNGIVASYDHLAAHDASGLEKLSLTFTKFELSWLPDGGIMTSDDWMQTA